MAIRISKVVRKQFKGRRAKQIKGRRNAYLIKRGILIRAEEMEADADETLAAMGYTVIVTGGVLSADMQMADRRHRSDRSSFSCKKKILLD